MRSLGLTRHLKNLRWPNPYVLKMEQEFAGWAFDEEAAPALKGRWREQIFCCDREVPLDLEIGTGNGLFFAHHARRHPERRLVGIEYKYKPLVQSIRRALRQGSQNARIVRYNAALAAELFEPLEINNVYIHFPDPWSRRSHWKHRLIGDGYLQQLHGLQRSTSFVEFKTDDRSYFDWAVEHFSRSAYKIQDLSYNWHEEKKLQTEGAAEEQFLFMTHFERLFTQQGLPIHRLKAVKP